MKSMDDPMVIIVSQKFVYGIKLVMIYQEMWLGKLQGGKKEISWNWFILIFSNERSQKVAGTMQALLGGDEIYHYHSKLMMKEAQSGG